MDLEDTLDSNLNETLSLNSESKNYLRESARWTKFIAIVYFVILGLIVLMMLFAGSMMSYFLPVSEMGGSAAAGGLMFAYFLFMGIFIFFPALFMYRFATKTKLALESESTALLSEGLKNMKSYWKFMGILMAIFVGIYALSFLLLLVTGGAAAFM